MKRSASSIFVAWKAPAVSPKFLLGLAVLTLGSAPLVAQQPYWANGYGSGAYGGGNGQYAYPNQPQQYAPSQQYAQPQLSAPQYRQPQQYAQPQYSQSLPYDSQAQPYAQQADAEQAYGAEQQAQPPLDADQLEQLVAPIALYPDQLLADILTASTYPAEVAVASQWLQQMQAEGAASPDQIAAGADAQSSWDPSIKALTAFPQVLDMMDRNLEWTTNLGNSYYNQPQDVMQTVQLMRQRAEDAGNLQSSPQEQMTYDQGAIELAPANPQTVYVPDYNPWDVYGQPVSPYPGFSLLGALGSFFGSAPIHYGLGIGMAAFNRMPWGLAVWALDWLGHEIFFNHGSYFTHSTTVADWGFPRGGPRAYGGWARDPRYAGIGRGVQSYASVNSRVGSASPYGYARPVQPVVRPAQSFERPAQQFPRDEVYNRSVPAQNYGAIRPTMPGMQAYNRMPQQPIVRPQPYISSPYNYANRPLQPNAARPTTTYPSPYSSFRAPEQTAPRAFAQAPARSFSSEPQRSGGFSLFSHNSQPKSYAGSFGGERAPKSFSGGGSHFKAPKESHSSGGGGGRRRR